MASSAATALYVPKITPTGALAETASRAIMTNTVVTLTAQRPAFTAIYLEAGQVVSAITFVATQAGTPTAQWFGLFNASWTVLAVSADDGANAWNTGAAKTLNMGVPYTVPTSGIYYVAVCVSGTVPRLLAAVPQYGGVFTPYAFAQDQWNTSAPPSVGTTLTHVSGGVGAVHYAYVS